MDYIIQRLRREDPTRFTKSSIVVKLDLRNFAERYNMRPAGGTGSNVACIRLRFEKNNPADGIRVFEPPRDPSGAGFIMATVVREQFQSRTSKKLVIMTPTMLEWLRRYESP
ncbi:hypothetical protein Q1695_003021 [Nippostrongylus brasiliensis]|nr:hypothetical protein Q1695_003021 [Nippostrongylus brasiliensis]